MATLYKVFSYKTTLMKMLSIRRLLVSQKLYPAYLFRPVAIDNGHYSLAINNTRFNSLSGLKTNRLINPTATFNPSKKLSVIRGEHGFTLTELMVTIAILAIIVIIATPSILKQLASMEAKRIKNQLTTILTTAKAESYIRRQNVLLCLSNTSGQCHRDGYQKLLLFVDHNDNKHFDTQTDYLLNEQFLHLKYSTLHLRVGANRHYTKFWGDSGKPRGHFGHIKYCPTANYNQHKYQISFNQGGIIKHKPNSIHDTGC